MGLAHGTVEDEDGAACGARGGGVDGEIAAVPSHSHVGQSAGSAGMFGGFGLTVLGDGHHLQVIVAAEGAEDGPVMRDAHALPLRIIVIGSFGSGGITAMESPSLREGLLNALCRKAEGAAEEKESGKDSHGVYCSE